MDECCAPSPLNLGGSRKQDDAYRRVLWAVLAINAAMFAVEVIAGLAAGSAALQADAMDFLGDAANCAISLLVVGRALRYRASAALAKGRDDCCLWLMGYRNRDLARFEGNAAERVHNGHRWRRGAASQCCIVLTALGLSSWRCQYALRMDLHTQRCTRQSGGSVGGAWRLRHRDGMG
jgi:hypothetical protein